MLMRRNAGEREGERLWHLKGKGKGVRESPEQASRQAGQLGRALAAASVRSGAPSSSGAAQSGCSA